MTLKADFSFEFALPIEKLKSLNVFENGHTSGSVGASLRDVRKCQLGLSASSVPSKLLKRQSLGVKVAYYSLQSLLHRTAIDAQKTDQ